MGGALVHVNSGSINYYSIHLMESLCIVAVNDFILLQGIFLIKKKM